MVSGPIDSGDAGDVPDDTWFSKAYNLGGVSVKLTGYAICLG
jgi:hypothetical protein